MRIKKILVLLVIASLALTGCSSNSLKSDQMSENEIKELLSTVIGGEEALLEAGRNYFYSLSTENNNMVTPAKVNEITQGNMSEYYLLDIRQPADFQNGHIKGANNIFWFDIGGSLEKLPKDKHIIVYCYSGQSAGQVVGALSVLGFKVSSMQGGWNGGWIANNMPVVN